MQKQNINFKKEFSAGCVVFKKQSTINNQQLTIVFLLGKHSGYHKWVLPKGLIEKGERGWQAAIRETEEELGVKAQLVSNKPISKEQYIFYADYKPQPQISNFQFLISKQIPNSKIIDFKQSNNLTINNSLGSRRVKKYQEQGGSKVKVFKTVSFYLAEYASGDPKKHGWEMEEAGWFNFDEALALMAFKGEKEALQKAYNYLKFR